MASAKGDYKIWLDNLQDLLVPHIFRGLAETYEGVLRLTGGVKTLMTFQIALSGIADLTKSKIMADYEILMTTLRRNGNTVDWFNEILVHLYKNYTVSALCSAGLKCDELHEDIVETPDGPDFVNHVYVNTARQVWQDPGLFWHGHNDMQRQANNLQIQRIIKDAIERTVRDSVNLNKIIKTFNQRGGTSAERKVVLASSGATTAPAAPSHVEDIRSKFSKLSKRSILDDDDSSSDSDEELEAIEKSSSEPPIHEASIHEAPIREAPPPSPSSIGGETVDNDDLAPDTATIDSRPSSLPLMIGPSQPEPDVSSEKTINAPAPAPAPAPASDSQAESELVSASASASDSDSQAQSELEKDEPEEISIKIPRKTQPFHQHQKESPVTTQEPAKTEADSLKSKTLMPDIKPDQREKTDVLKFTVGGETPRDMDDDETGTNYTVITGKPQAKTKIKPVIKKKQQLDEETVDVEVVTNDADAEAEAAPINLKFIDMEEALSSRLSMIRRKKNSVS